VFKAALVRSLAAPQGALLAGRGLDVPLGRRGALELAYASSHGALSSTATAILASVPSRATAPRTSGSRSLPSIDYRNQCRILEHGGFGDDGSGWSIIRSRRHGQCNAVKVTLTSGCRSRFGRDDPSCSDCSCAFVADDLAFAQPHLGPRFAVDERYLAHLQPGRGGEPLRVHLALTGMMLERVLLGYLLTVVTSLSVL
jgi:hypothetical protein